MKRSRLFLILVIILLVINTLFFVAWYGLDVKGRVKALVEKEAGKALEGTMKIRAFSISDRQIFAEGISFAAADSSLAFEVDQARVRYNLLKFLFSGFRIRHLLNVVEITRPTVHYEYIPKDEDKPSPKFEIPDLAKYFNRLLVTDGRASARLSIPLTLGNGDTLIIDEGLTDIYISVLNNKTSRIDVSALSATKGKIRAWGFLNNGRLISSEAEITNFVPKYISHPAIRDTNTELNLVLKASQLSKDSEYDIDAKLLVWNTRAYILDQYQLSIPLIALDTNGRDLSISISESSFGTSRLSLRASVAGIQNEMKITSGDAGVTLDLSMIDPSITGLVSGKVNLGGSIRKPEAEIKAETALLSVAGEKIENISLTGQYADDILKFDLGSAKWAQHLISAQGVIDVSHLDIAADVKATPLDVAFGDLRLEGQAKFEVSLYEKYPDVKALITQMNVSRGSFGLQSLQGYINLIPANSAVANNYYIDCELKDAAGQKLEIVGDILDRNILVNSEFKAISIADIYPHELVLRYLPRVSGSVNGFIRGDRIIARTELNVGTRGDMALNTGLSAIGSYDIKTGDASLALNTAGGSFNGETLNLEIIASRHEDLIAVNSLRVNNYLSANGMLDINKPERSNFTLVVRDFALDLISKYYPSMDTELPDIRGINLVAEYNHARDGTLDAKLSVSEINIPGIKQLAAITEIIGTLDNASISGRGFSNGRDVMLLSGKAGITNGFYIASEGIVTDIALGDIIPDVPVEGLFSGKLGFSYGSDDSPYKGMSLQADLSSTALSITDVVDLADLRIVARQDPERLIVDTLAVRSAGIARLQASGALSYNIVFGEFHDGNETLELHAEGELFEWLKTTVPTITDAVGLASINCRIGTHEDQFSIISGDIDIRDGMIKLESQSEAMSSIRIKANITNDKVLITDAGLTMGQGRLNIRNSFEDDPGNHFFVGFLDLGIFRASIEEPGITANIPYFTAPRTLTNIVLRGRDAPYATILGPFDDMKISAAVFLSEGNAVYPPDTDNLLKLISSFRGVLSRPSSTTVASADPTPLPFTLDLMIQLRDNVRYVTYPANLSIMPGGFLHLTYDGQDWKADEANFSSDSGTIDFLGTVFQAEYLDISIIDSRDIISIDGSFYRRTADGTVITLTISTDRDTSKGIFDRLVFTLSSDNPQDRSITEILSRLRYSRDAGELSSTQTQNLLQDEALGLISDNLNTTLLSPFFYPLENHVRRILKLDSFSIDAGFIQNLFTQYTNDPNQLAEFMDMQRVMEDITQFSSSILLNNLSVSMSKYLGRKLFLDYRLTLQEATDLQKKTKILISHDTSLRVFLPRQFRLAYTFKYEPQDERLTHGMMLQRSFRFWGL